MTEILDKVEASNRAMNELVLCQTSVRMNTVDDQKLMKGRIVLVKHKGGIIMHCFRVQFYLLHLVFWGEIYEHDYLYNKLVLWRQEYPLPLKTQICKNL